MYIGRRDPEIPILVRLNACQTYDSQNSGTWIEIKIPYPKRSNNPYHTGSIMVRPEQVYYVNDRYNLNIYNQIMVNDKANIICSTKDENRVVLYKEIMPPDLIIGCLLAYELTGHYDDKTVTELDLYNAFRDTGLTMLEYIVRVTQNCIDWKGNIQTPKPRTAVF